MTKYRDLSPAARTGQWEGCSLGAAPELAAAAHPAKMCVPLPCHRSGAAPQLCANTPHLALCHCTAALGCAGATPRGLALPAVTRGAKAFVVN